MPRLEYFLVAASVSIDQATNNVSLFHILEEVTGRMPLTMPPLVAASSWLVAPEERGQDFQASLRIRLPDGHAAPESNSFNVNFTTDRSRHRMHMFVEGLVVPAAGDLVFELLLNGEHQAEHTVSVNRRDES